MKSTNREIVAWAPRVLGLSVVAFLSLFATDAFNGRGILDTTVAVLMGLIPALVVLTAVTIGWRHEGIAAVVFVGLGCLYAAYALRHPTWIAVISGPLVVVGGLYFVSWRVKSRNRGSAPARA